MRELISQIALERHSLDSARTFVFHDIATEGITTAMVADVGHKLHASASKVKGWFEGVTKKRNHINEIAVNTIDWLKDMNKEYPKLDLDMNSFKTFLKTSEVHSYRYYYLLNDSVYNRIVEGLKKDEIVELEDFLSHLVNDISVVKSMNSKDMADRKSATRMLDNLRRIDDLILLVNKYNARCSIIFDLLEKRERTVKGFPFQLMLSGMVDLRTIVKRITNLST